MASLVSTNANLAAHVYRTGECPLCLLKGKHVKMLLAIDQHACPDPRCNFRVPAK